VITYLLRTADPGNKREFGGRTGTGAAFKASEHDVAALHEQI
jgi:hypothetical protein